MSRPTLPLLISLLAIGCQGKGSVQIDDSVGDDTGIQDVDRDGYTSVLDCDDSNASVHPDADEICDGLDNDCDTEIDEDTPTTWYTDSDGDGYGDDTTAVTSCEQPVGSVSEGGDCNDADPAYHPGATEADCTDPNDYNCDGSAGTADADADGYAACAECDDGNAAINPGASEVCDDADNDCDGTTDVGASDAPTWYTDSDADGYGGTGTAACDQPEGTTADGSDCDDTDVTVNPSGTETCNAKDDDCDGEIDEDLTDGGSTWYADSDGDGYGDASVSTVACAQPDGYVADNTDCDDNDASVTYGEIYYTDADGDGYGDPATRVTACAKPTGTVKNQLDCDDDNASVSPDGTEICDDLDNDCDDVIDWGHRVPTDYSAIQDAIDDLDDGDTICVEAGTYVEQIDFDGTDLSVIGTDGAASTIIDGDGDGPVVTFSSREGSGARLSGFTITNGEASQGAGIYIEEAEPTLDNLLVTANTCDSSTCYGVGIYAEGSDFTLSSSQVTGNSFEAGGGGSYSSGAGVYLTGSDVQFTDVEISDNAITADSGSYVYTYCAGLCVHNDSALDFNGGSISGNSIDLSDITYGTAYGAGLYAYNSVDITLNNVWIVDNTATVAGGYAFGGGLALYYNVDASATNVIVANNQAISSGASSYANGGGIYAGYYADLNLENVDIVGNAAEGSQSFGGGLYLYYYAALEAVNTNFVSNTVAGSSSGSGGGLALSYISSRDFELTWSNIYGNTEPEVHGEPTPVGSDGNISVDPLYTDVSAASALDWDLTLSSGSACIDAGDSTISDADGSTSDIGAYGGEGADLGGSP